MSGADTTENRMFQLVFPGDTNHLGTLYGGTLMSWMDTAAAIAGVRRAGSVAVVTAAVERLEFQVAIREGELVELVARVDSVGRTSMRVTVEAHREDPVSKARELCTTGVFTMVALGADGKPTPVRPLPEAQG